MNNPSKPAKMVRQLKFIATTLVFEGEGDKRDAIILWHYGEPASTLKLLFYFTLHYAQAPLTLWWTS